MLDFGGIPKYQDAAFKIDLPTKKYGKFSVFFLGGESHIDQQDEDEFRCFAYEPGESEL